MIASVHIADIGAGSALGVLRKPPRSGSIPGLRHASVALAAPLSGSLRPSPDLGRVGLIAFWDDDAALDGFLAGHPLAEKLADGWRARLAPLRAHGSWPGLPDDVPAQRSVDHEGPAVVLTLGRVRLSRVLPFFRASAKAEGRVLDAPGLVWATGLARPPFVATCSLWKDTRALSTYAYGAAHPEHPDAVAADRARPFHVQSAFVRFAPSDSQGGLEGRNPLPEDWNAASV
ncbi:MAG TPA: spheroidene monooxygenase [Acidimicrobiia bacterium]|nr:spheroidene monooxygenase [Acidimicrobiia bacterium]